ncbi:hypothetical protein O6H91_Y056800 [Diphasiastrum complanatum]|nr:hypothetical protein O6H91_Y056800 [Diphasiastrum complanatum]
MSTKGDVYSYGMVLLEMLTLQRPSSGILLNGMTLPKWVQGVLEANPEKVIDSNLLQDADEVVIGMIVESLKLALSCTNESPKDRPGMKDVLAALLKIQKQQNTNSEEHDHRQIST